MAPGRPTAARETEETEREQQSSPSLRVRTMRTSLCSDLGLAREAIFIFYFFWAQFSRKLARLYEYSYLGPVLYMNIHIAHDTKVFVTLREKKKQ